MWWRIFSWSCCLTEKLHELYNDLPFLPERMKIKVVEKLVANLHEHIRNLKHSIKSWISFKKSSLSD